MPPEHSSHDALPPPHPGTLLMRHQLWASHNGGRAAYQIGLETIPAWLYAYMMHLFSETTDWNLLQYELLIQRLSPRGLHIEPNQLYVMFNDWFHMDKHLRDRWSRSRVALPSYVPDRFNSDVNNRTIRHPDAPEPIRFNDIVDLVPLQVQLERVSDDFIADLESRPGCSRNPIRSSLAYVDPALLNLSPRSDSQPAAQSSRSHCQENTDEAGRGKNVTYKDHRGQPLDQRHDISHGHPQSSHLGDVEARQEIAHREATLIIDDERGEARIATVNEDQTYECQPTLLTNMMEATPKGTRRKVSLIINDDTGEARVVVTNHSQVQDEVRAPGDSSQIFAQSDGSPSSSSNRENPGGSSLPTVYSDCRSESPSNKKTTAIHGSHQETTEVTETESPKPRRRLSTSPASFTATPTDASLRTPIPIRGRVAESSASDSNRSYTIRGSSPAKSHTLSPPLKSCLRRSNSVVRRVRFELESVLNSEADKTSPAPDTNANTHTTSRYKSPSPPPPIFTPLPSLPQPPEKASSPSPPESKPANRPLYSHRAYLATLRDTPIPEEGLRLHSITGLPKVLLSTAPRHTVNWYMSNWRPTWPSSISDLIPGHVFVCPDDGCGVTCIAKRDMKKHMRLKHKASKAFVVDTLPVRAVVDPRSAVGVNKRTRWRLAEDWETDDEFFGAEQA